MHSVLYYGEKVGASNSYLLKISRLTVWEDCLIPCLLVFKEEAGTIVPSADDGWLFKSASLALIPLALKALGQTTESSSWVWVWYKYVPYPHTAKNEWHLWTDLESPGIIRGGLDRMRHCTWLCFWLKMTEKSVDAPHIGRHCGWVTSPPAIWNSLWCQSAKFHVPGRGFFSSMFDRQNNCLFSILTSKVRTPRIRITRCLERFCACRYTTSVTRLQCNFFHQSITGFFSLHVPKLRV